MILDQSEFEIIFPFIDLEINSVIIDLLAKVPSLARGF